MMYIYIMRRFAEGLYVPFIIALKIIGILILAYMAIKFGNYAIKKVISRQGRFNLLDEKRLNTLGAILSSILKYGVYLIAAITILTNVTGILDLRTVLAAAGIGGVALGLGAQSLIKDLISGLFILIENQYSVGDMITVDNMNGTVEDIEIRVTRIRNFNGDLYIIPNGEIRRVTNHTKQFKLAIVDIPVSYETNADQAIEVANEVCSEFPNDNGKIIEKPQVLGITEFGEEGFMVRMIVKVVPGEQWAIERELRKRIIEKYNSKKIGFINRITIM